MESMLNKFKNFSEMVAFPHTIFSSTFILIAMIVSSKEINHSVWMGMERFLLCAIALISARNFAMGFNRLADRDIDVLNPRTSRRPSVDGRISLFSMRVFCALNGAIFIATAYFINDLALYLSVPFLLILGAYSYMKRFSFLAHIVLGISLALAPIAGNIAIAGALESWCVALGLGVMFWVAGFDLLYSLQDIKFDKLNKLHSIPSIFGEQKTLYISRVFHLLAILCWSFFVYLADLGIYALLGLVLSAIMLVYEQILVRRDFANIPKAFFTTNGYLGFVFFVFILIDLI